MKTRILQIAAAWALGLGPTMTLAAELDPRPYIVGGITYNELDEDRGLEDDEWGFHFALGKAFSQYINLELQATTWESDEKIGSGEARLKGIGANLLFFPNRDELPIYGLLGVMAANIEGTVGGFKVDEDGELYDIGFGALFQLSDHGTALRLEYRHRFTEIATGGVCKCDIADDTEDDVLMLAIQVPLGRAAGAPPPPPPPPPVIPRKPIVLKDVWFKFDSAELLPASSAKLDEVAASLEDNEDVEVLLSGHTCNMGSDEYNLSLSQRRVNSVKAYLVTKGIAGSRVQARGYGESRPIADNATKAGREQNRRVEIQRID